MEQKIIDVQIIERENGTFQIETLEGRFIDLLSREKLIEKKNNGELKIVNHRTIKLGEQNIIKLFKPIKQLDAEIEKIFFPFKNQHDEEDFFRVEVGLVESLGEQGYSTTFFYDTEPTGKEIIEDIKEHIKEELESLRNSILSGREEKYLEIFEKLEKKGVLN